jgi:hypothetical protein
MIDGVAESCGESSQEGRRRGRASGQPVDRTRTAISPVLLNKLIKENVRRALTIAGRQFSTWNVGPAVRCEPDEQGCNWKAYIAASEDIRSIAQPALDEARRRYHLLGRGQPRS